MYELTEEQKDFATEVKESNDNISLNAVAGSGKTTTMLEAVNGLPFRIGHSILACAFNSKNAKELGEKMPNHVESKTLNALGHGAFQRHYGKKLYLKKNKVGIAVSEFCTKMEDRELYFPLRDLVQAAKKEGMAFPVNHKHDTPENEMQFLLEDTYENWETIGYKYNVDFPSNEVARRKRIDYAREILQHGIGEALIDGVIDFDDQLYMTHLIDAPMTKYDLILVDEAQDLSPLQHELVVSSLKEGGRLIIVGDPKQAIYGFRGADSASMSKLASRFNMMDMTLSYNFRCGKDIVDRASRIVPILKAHHTNPQGRVDHLHEWELNELEEDSAVLCRNVFPIVATGFACIRAGISVKMVGRDLGAGLSRLCEKMAGDTEDALILSIMNWYEMQRVVFEAKKDLEALHRMEIPNGLCLQFSPLAGRPMQG